MKQKMNFNHLHYFVTIAREGSIVKASKKLHITQPALSHQLKLFEEDLGVKLFDRKGKRLHINQNGEQVLAYGERIFRQSDEMLELVKHGEASNTRIIKVGIVSWMPKEHVYALLRTKLLSPHIKVQVFQKDLTTLLSDVQTDELDIVLCDSPYSGRSKKLIGRKITSEPIVAICSIKDNIKGKFPKSLNNKKGISLLEVSEIKDHIDAFIIDNELDMTVVGEMADSSLLLYTIERGGVVGFLPETIAKTGLKRKSIKKLGKIGNAQFSVWAIHKKSESRTGLIHNLIKNFKIT